MPERHSATEEAKWNVDAALDPSENDTDPQVAGQAAAPQGVGPTKPPSNGGWTTGPAALGDALSSQPERRLSNGQEQSGDGWHCTGRAAVPTPEAANDSSPPPPQNPADRVPLTSGAWKSGAGPVRNPNGSLRADRYEVGYGKPPKHTRFKKGQSGNPKGRMPLHARSISKSQIDRDVLVVMQAEVTTKLGGKRVRVPAVMALFCAMIEKALSGDVRAMKLVMESYLVH